MNEQQTFTIGAFSKKTGIAVHTLHYYDELGLLQPAKHPTSGHRIYTVADAILLQKILSLKFLGYRLEDIKALLHETHFTANLNESLVLHLDALQQEQQRISQSIESIQRVMALVEQQKTIDSELLFSLVHSMRTAHVHEEWMAQHKLHDVAAALEQKSDAQKQALDESFIDVTKQVKALYGQPVLHPDVQLMVQRYMDALFIFLGDELIEQLANTNIEELDLRALEQATPSPLSDDEQAWLNEAMAYAATASEHDTMND